MASTWAQPQKARRGLIIIGIIVGFAFGPVEIAFRLLKAIDHGLGVNSSRSSDLCGHDRAAIHVHYVLGLVRQARTAVIELRDLRVWLDRSVSTGLTHGRREIDEQSAYTVK